MIVLGIKVWDRARDWYRVRVSCCGLVIGLWLGLRICVVE